LKNVWLCPHIVHVGLAIYMVFLLDSDLVVVMELYMVIKTVLVVNFQLIRRSFIDLIFDGGDGNTMSLKEFKEQVTMNGM
jgi:hypothetical protein